MTTMSFRARCARRRCRAHDAPREGAACPWSRGPDEAAECFQHVGATDISQEAEPPKVDAEQGSVVFGMRNGARRVEERAVPAECNHDIGFTADFFARHHRPAIAKPGAFGAVLFNHGPASFADRNSAAGQGAERLASVFRNQRRVILPGTA